MKNEMAKFYTIDQVLLSELFKIASRTFILATESDIGVGTVLFSITACENKSP